MPASEWRKSSYSAGANGCVEIRWPEDGVAVRDSKNPAGPVLSFSTADWRAFLTPDRGRAG